MVNIESTSSQVQVTLYAMLSEIVLLISETADFQTLLQKLVKKVKWVLDFNRCTLSLLDDGGETYRLQTLFETRRNVAKVDQIEIPIEDGIMGEAIRSRKMQWITEPAANKIEINNPVDVTLWDGSINAVLSLPLQAYGSILGVLTFATVRDNGYSYEDIKVALSIASHLSLAIDRWQQAQKLQRANQELGFMRGAHR